MATWDKIQRAVMLKANELNASTAANLASTYSVATIGQTELADRGIEFPAAAINDCILDAGGIMVEVIGQNPISPYRTYFHDTTDSILDGSRIPEFSQAGHPVVGKIGAVRDSSDSQECEFKARQEVDGANSITTLKVSPYWFNTDGTRIWHTRDAVTADVVVWESQVHRYWMEASPRGICPFPDSLHPALINGALSLLFRGEFNIEQSEGFNSRFQLSLEGLK
jgi:hypothetical protein